MKSEKIDIPDKKEISRRDFLKKSARGGILLLLGALIGGLAAKKKINLPGDKDCINNSICVRCRINNNCGLPQALSYRDAGRGSGKGNS